MPTRLASLARSLRRNATNAERRLWQALRRKEVAGPAFAGRSRSAAPSPTSPPSTQGSSSTPGLRSGDGATRSTEAELARDAARTAALAAQGFAILRFTNDEVFHNLDGVLETVRLKLMELRPRIADSAS